MLDELNNLFRKKPERNLDKGMKYISRTDSDKNRAHHWTVNINVKDQRINKTFADIKNGGKNSALLAAISFRQRIADEHNLSLSKEFRKQPFDPEKEGVYIKQKTSNGYTYSFAIAYWHETIKNKRVRKYKSFSINKHGENKAKRLARKFRREKLNELYA